MTIPPDSILTASEKEIQKVTEDAYLIMGASAAASIHRALTSAAVQYGLKLPVPAQTLQLLCESMRVAMQRLDAAGLIDVERGTEMIAVLQQSANTQGKKNGKPPH